MSGRRPVSTGSSPGRPLSTSSVGSSSASASSSARYSDRFIPSRAGSGDFRAAFSLLRKSYPGCSTENAASVGNATSDTARGVSTESVWAAMHRATERSLSGETVTAAGGADAGIVGGGGGGAAGDASNARQSYDLLLKSELLDVDTCGDAGKHLLLAAAGSTASPSSKAVCDVHGAAVGATTSFGSDSVGGPNLFRFRSVAPNYGGGVDEAGGCGAGGTGLTCGGVPGLGGNTGGVGIGDPDFRRFSVGGGGKDAAVSAAAFAAISANPRRGSRKISRTPFKVLDAPALTDDFYLNLVDWSAENVLAVGLGSCVYLWSACTSLVTKLCDLGHDGPVCSVAWSVSGKELAVGTGSGLLQVWDAASCTLVRAMGGHSARIGCLAWSSSLLSSGSRDAHIYNRDMRAPESYVGNLVGHCQEVCGLKWSPDDMQLASGGNDNQLLVWSSARTGGTETSRGDAQGGRAGTTVWARSEPLFRFTLHRAAVKAIAWSPHARGLLASGGGTADRTMRFWNTVTQTALGSVDTGSQVCNLAWSKNVNEIVSTHGYSQNQIIVWRYPSLSKVVTLTGHTQRVLYLALSPTGETIVTGCGDETLRFWNLFPSAANSQLSSNVSMLSPERMHIR
jgi:cell division cycle 20-like protein 1, cofactor of APC complex